MVNAQLFYTIFLLIPPLLGSVVLSLAYLSYLDNYMNAKIWIPNAIGLMTPSILVLFRIGLYIPGYILWIAFAIVFWIKWDDAAGITAEVRELSLKEIGVGGDSASESNSEESNIPLISGMTKFLAMLGILVLYPLMCGVMNLYLAFVIRHRY